MVEEHITLEYLIEQLTGLQGENYNNAEQEDNVFMNEENQQIRVLSSTETESGDNFPEKIQAFFKHPKKIFRQGVVQIEKKPDGAYNITPYSCILECLHKNYHQLDEIEKIQGVICLKKLLYNQIYKEKIFKTYGYNRYGWNRPLLTKNLDSKNIENPEIIFKYLADFFKINIFLFNFSKQEISVVCGDLEGVMEENKQIQLTPLFHKNLVSIFLADNDGCYEPIGYLKHGKRQLQWTYNHKIYRNFLQKNTSNIILYLSQNDDTQTYLSECLPEEKKE